jgi:hypothetical protein
MAVLLSPGPTKAWLTSPVTVAVLPSPPLQALAMLLKPVARAELRSPAVANAQRRGQISRELKAARQRVIEDGND